MKVQCCDDRPMSWRSLVVKLGPRTLEKALSVLPHSLKLNRENVLNRQYLSLGLFDFAEILYIV